MSSLSWFVGLRYVRARSHKFFVSFITWVSLLCVATLAWRGAITLRGKRMPSTLVLLPVAVAAMAGIQFSYQTLLGRDAGVAMLVLLVAFKMLEMHARRDLYVVIFLCFFLVLTNFFYVFPDVGAVFALLAYVTVALGGFGNVPATLLGGVLIGLIENLVGLWAPAFKYVGVFCFYLLVVLWRPQGLFGRY